MPSFFGLFALPDGFVHLHPSTGTPSFHRGLSACRMESRRSDRPSSPLLSSIGPLSSRSPLFRCLFNSAPSNGEAKRILERLKKPVRRFVEALHKLRASIIKRAPDSGALDLGDLQIVHRQPVGTNQRKVLKLQLPPSPL